MIHHKRRLLCGARLAARPAARGFLAGASALPRDGTLEGVGPSGGAQPDGASASRRARTRPARRRPPPRLRDARVLLDVRGRSRRCGDRGCDRQRDRERYGDRVVGGHGHPVVLSATVCDDGRRARVACRARRHSVFVRDATQRRAQTRPIHVGPMRIIAGWPRGRRLASGERKGSRDVRLSHGDLCAPRPGDWCSRSPGARPERARRARVRGVDVKVTNDNNNVDGGTPNLGFDAQNRQSNETTARSALRIRTSCRRRNDYRMVTVTGDVWPGLYARRTRSNLVQHDGAGAPSDTPRLGSTPSLDSRAGDPVVDSPERDLYVAAIAFNRTLRSAGPPVDNLVYVARYDYTPGMPGRHEHAEQRSANPPNFTYVADDGRRPAGRRLRRPSTRRLRRHAHGQGVDGGRHQLRRHSSVRRGHRPTRTSTAHLGASNADRLQPRGRAEAASRRPKTISTGGLRAPNNQGADIAVAADGHGSTPVPGVRADPERVDQPRALDRVAAAREPAGGVGAITHLRRRVSHRSQGSAFVAGGRHESDVYVAYQSLARLRLPRLRPTLDGRCAELVGFGAGERGSGGDPSDLPHHRRLERGFCTSPGTTSGTAPPRAMRRSTSTRVFEHARVSAYPGAQQRFRVTDVSHNGNACSSAAGRRPSTATTTSRRPLEGANHVVHAAWATRGRLALRPASGPGWRTTRATATRTLRRQADRRAEASCRGGARMRTPRLATRSAQRSAPMGLHSGSATSSSRANRISPSSA